MPGYKGRPLHHPLIRGPHHALTVTISEPLFQAMQEYTVILSYREMVEFALIDWLDSMRLNHTRSAEEELS